jgi:hypothetical protein
LSAFQSLPGVAYVQPDYQVSATYVPDDTQFGSQNDLGVIQATAAWDVATGTGTTIVAVIDTGVDYNHPDLAANIWTNPGEVPGNGVDDNQDGYVDDVHGFDFVNYDGDPMDDHSHGTHVAGTIGAVGNNGLGIAGVTWNVQIMALKFLNSSGSGSTSNAISALNYAVSHGAKISNNSWGGGGYNQALYDAINSARARGHIYVAAAGNNASSNDSTPFYPASYDLSNVISVAATDNNDNLASFSNYGLSVSLAAPGVGILSTMPGGGYGYKNGTSMAAPHVAGALALIWDAHPTWTYQQVINQVLSTADVLPSLQGKVGSGGRLNLAAALTSESTMPTAPAAPTSLAAGNVTTSALTLTWIDNADNETGYVVQRQSGGTWTTVATLGADATTYQNTGLSAGTTYSYRVQAFNAGGDSAYSNVVTTTTASPPLTAPNAPSRLTGSAKPKPSMRINLTWTDNATNEAGFRVYRSSDGGATWSVLVQLGANVGNYVDSSVAASRTYSYRVTAFNGAGESAFSNTATITTPGGTGKQSSSDVPFLDAPINDKRPWWLLS